MISAYYYNIFYFGLQLFRAKKTDFIVENQQQFNVFLYVFYDKCDGFV